jgi:phage FluMu protein Com
MIAAPRECPPTPPLNAWRCWRCGRLLARLLLMAGSTVEIKCRDCRAINVATVDNNRPAA